MTQRQALMLFGAIGMLTPVGAFALVMLNLVDPHPASDVAALGPLIGILGTIATPFLPLAGRGMARRDRIIDLLVLWTWASVFAQFGWELPFVLLSPWLKGATAADHHFFLFWAYGVADQRYLIADPFTVCMEGVTSIVGGPLQLLGLWWWKHGKWRQAAALGIVVSATQFYGTVLFFGIEALEHFQHVGSGLFGICIKFVGLNIIWGLMPPLCVYIYAKALIIDPFREAADKMRK